MTVVDNVTEEQDDRFREPDAGEARLDAVAEEIDRRVEAEGVDVSTTRRSDEVRYQQIRDAVLTEHEVTLKELHGREDRISGEDGNQPGVFYPRRGLTPREAGPGCPHCSDSLTWNCRDCERQFDEIRAALGTRSSVLSNADLIFMLRAIHADRDSYESLIRVPLAKGEWEPVVPALREAWMWLIAENTAVSALPPSKRPGGFRPLERWKNRIPGWDVESIR